MNTEIKNAIITSTRITTEDGVLSVWLTLDYGDSCQGFGGYVLHLPKTFKNHKLYSVAGHFICRVMSVAGVINWEDMNGKPIRVKSDSSSIYAIGHIINDDWFCPKEDFSNDV